MQLDHLAVDILKKITAEPGMPPKLLCERIGLSQRNFHYRRSRINDWLTSQGFSSLQCDPLTGVRVAEEEAAAILHQLSAIHAQHYRLSAAERRDNLLLHLACRIQPAFTQQLSELNRVSRNTTLDDVRLLRQHLQTHQLTLEVDKKQGYSLAGSDLALRLIVQQTLQHGLKYADHQAEARIAQTLMTPLVQAGKEACQIHPLIDDQLRQAESLLNRTFTDKDRRALHYMLIFLLVDTLNGHMPQFTPVQSRFLREQAECETAASVNASLSAALALPEMSGNMLFISLLFSASKKVAPQTGQKEGNSRLTASVKHLITQFQALSGVYLNDAEQLESRLISHLGPAIRRCLFGMRSENALREEILQRYPMIFRLCRQIVATLEQDYQVTFCDDELSYIAISFAAWLDRRPETREQHLLLVTEGGISSTAILENQLRNLTVLPLHIERMSASQLQQQGIGRHIRLVVSTIVLNVPIPAQVSFIQTQHILTDSEKQQLRLLLEHRIESAGIAELVDSLVASTSRLASQPQETLRQEFSHIISLFFKRQQHSVQAVSSQHYAQHSFVNFTASQASWHQLIRKAAQPLRDNGIVDAKYVRNIVRKIEQQGVSTYLTPDILLLHDAPPANATEGALSLLKLKHPLHFDLPGVSLTPRIIAILVPTATLSHIPMLEAFNALLSDDQRLEGLINASSLQEVKMSIGNSLVF